MAKKETAVKAEYKVLGDKFKEKKAANEALAAIHGKGFKGAGLMVKGAEFIILHGTYKTLAIANANAAAITKAGFKAAVEE